MKNFIEYDVFGNPIECSGILRNKFIENPFSVLDTKSGSWNHRVKLWKDLGIKSEVGRKAVAIHMSSDKDTHNLENYTSIFDPALCEVLYRWFCPEGGVILDPFAGGSVRGIVANYLGYHYTGIDIRAEQVESNIEQGSLICEKGNQPVWICGDSNRVLQGLEVSADFLFSCPPYADLEVYSNLPGDISNMKYPEFLEAYRSIIKKSCEKLKPGSLACFVVGEVRGKDGNYLGFVPDTIKAFMDAGMGYYNEAILLNKIVSASMRAAGNMKTRKLAKVHQNVLVFKKPDLL